MAKLSPLHQLEKCSVLFQSFQRCRVHVLCLMYASAEITFLFESSSCYLPCNLFTFFFFLTAFVPSFTMNIVLLRTVFLETAGGSTLSSSHHAYTSAVVHPCVHRVCLVRTRALSAEDNHLFEQKQENEVLISILQSCLLSSEMIPA